MPGPAPKRPEQRRRPNSGVQLVPLPSEGRKGAVPDWPIGRPSKGERELWAELWRTPQAVMWEQLGWTRVVARYTRIVLASEMPDAMVSLLGEVRQMEDRLGLSPMAMKRLGWDIQKDGEPADVRHLRTVSDRRRVKAVDPDAMERT
jgi:hypothetical protein